MTITTPQWVNDPGDSSITYDAGELRIMDTLYGYYDGQPLGSRTGVRPGGTGLQVTYTSSTWMVAPGIGAISAVASGAFGEYRFAVTATESGSIPAPDASNPRKDILVLTVRDADNGDASSEVVAQYLVGTPNATPTAPSVPAKSLLLATFTVPVSGSVSAVDERVYTVASGGILPTKTRPASPAMGATILNLTSGIVESWNGTDWLALSGGAPVFFTQTVAGPGTWTKPANAKYVVVELWGAGGAGGGAGGTTGQGEGGGGGGGAYVRKTYDASALNATEPFTIGAGGNGGGATGPTGGTSTFKGLSAGGGTGGTAMASTTGDGATVGGGGGVGTGGDLNVAGDDGGKGRVLAGKAILASMGGRAGGPGGGAQQPPGSTAAGAAGNIPGGGGSGAYGSVSGVLAGGDGAVGKIVIMTYF